ncbi:hypothetical protein LCGC14_1000210 [marine sediment metagenome]|uniref:RecG wedge domain-containing protein n=1 Tax=marine sediment metagenome TaxID=412755 RepID=A0A0F9N387_9ZZZZ
MYKRYYHSGVTVVSYRLDMMQLTNPKFKLIDGDTTIPDTFSGGIYPACKGLSSDQIKKVVKVVLDKGFDTIDITKPIQYVAGVGPKRAKLFNKLGVSNIDDLLNYFPRDWILPTDITDIGKLIVGKYAVVVGEITEVEYIHYGRMPRMDIVICDGDECKAMWFNGGWLRSQLKVGKMIMLAGKIEIRR